MGQLHKTLVQCQSPTRANSYNFLLQARDSTKLDPIVRSSGTIENRHSRLVFELRQTLLSRQIKVE